LVRTRTHPLLSTVGKLSSARENPFTDGRQEMVVLDSHSFTDRLRPVTNPPCFIVPAALQ
jgi:hypothetical protein